MKVLMYDLLYKSNQFDIFYISAILSVWPNILEEQSGSSTSILQKTIENIIFFHYKKLNCFEKKEFSSSLDFIEKSLGPLKHVNNNDFDEFIQEHLISLLEKEKIKELLREGNQVFEVYKCFQLIPVYKGWEWVYNNLICLKVATFMVPNVEEEILIFIIRLLGFLGKGALHSSSNFALPGCDQLRARLRFILLPNSPCNYSFSLL